MAGVNERYIDQFRLIRELGRGGMGVVYEAEETPIGRHVALKVLPAAISAEPGFRERFEREVRTTANLNHPNIIAVHRFGETEGRPYYTMELIDGISLDVLIRCPWLATQIHAVDDAAALVPAKSGGEGTVVMPGVDQSTVIASEFKVAAAAPDAASPQVKGPSRACPQEKEYYRVIARFIRDAARGLDFAHRNHVIHRDVKPANILLTRDGRVRVTDFGIAFEMGGVNLTRTGALIGTPRYMSPEQLLHREIRVDGRSDIYSLGVTLYELLTLRSAYGECSDQQLLLKIVVQDPLAPRQANPFLARDLETIVLKAMEKDPDQRYQRAEDMAQDLECFLRGEAISASPPSLPTRCIKVIRRHLVVSAAVTAAAVFLCVGSGVAWHVNALHRRAEISECITLARGFLDEGQAQKALSLLEAARRLDPRNDEAFQMSVTATRLLEERERYEEQARKEQRADVLRQAAAENAGIYAKALLERRDLEPWIEQAERDLNGVNPCNEGVDKVQLEEALIGMQERLEESSKTVTRSFAKASVLLQEALALAVDVSETKTRLVDLYLAAMRDAELHRDFEEADAMQGLAMLYDVEGSHAAELKGDGALSIVTLPPGAEVTLRRYVAEGNRLVAQPSGVLGKTPITSSPIAMGSYLLLIESPGYPLVRCPLFVRRQEDIALSIPLYTAEQVGPGMVYIPPAPCFLGGDPFGMTPLPAERPTLPGFLLGEAEVTCGEYLEFINDVAEKTPALARRLVPDVPWTGKDAGKPWWVIGKKTVSLPEYVQANFPVSGIDRGCVMTYLRWLSLKHGRVYRLPTAAEWERAARGADGRIYSWGNTPNPRYANVWGWSKFPYDVRKGPTAVKSFANDCSPFGIYDMVGNVHELCADFYRGSGHNVKGGAWYLDYMDPRHRLTSRREQAEGGHRALGFRLACDLPPVD